MKTKLLIGFCFVSLALADTLGEIQVYFSPNGGYSEAIVK